MRDPIAGLTPLSVARKYIRQGKAAGYSFKEACPAYSGGANYGGRLHYQIGGYVPKYQSHALRSYEMYVQVDGERRVFDLRELWHERDPSEPAQLTLF